MISLKHTGELARNSLKLASPSNRWLALIKSRQSTANSRVTRSIRGELNTLLEPTSTMWRIICHDTQAPLHRLTVSAVGCLDKVVMPTLGWRWLLGLSSLPSFLLLIFYNITPESPRYLCVKGRKSDAVSVLESIARMNQRVLPLGELVSDRREEIAKLDENAGDFQGIHAEQMRKSGSSIVGYLSSKFKCIGALHKLLSRKLIRTTLLLWMGFFGNAFTYYGVILLTSGLSDGDGICRPVHKNIKEGTNLYKDVFITSMAEVPGLILSALIVDRIGRKLSVASMLFATFAFLIPLVFHQKEVLTTALLFCARICITGSITTLCIYAPEIYPTSIRSTGYGTANSIGKIGGVISPLIAVGLVDGCHKVAAVLLFEAVILLAGMAVVFFPVETKGCKLKDSP